MYNEENKCIDITTYKDSSNENENKAKQLQDLIR